jgi:hypothetical protein
MCNFKWSGVLAIRTMQCIPMLLLYDTLHFCTTLCWIAGSAANISCYCTNSSHEWNVQLEGARHRKMTTRVTANEEWDSLFVISLCSARKEVLYTADQMIQHSNTLYVLRRAINTRANMMRTEQFIQ